MLSAIDLFSGCGGLTEGLKQAGFRVLGAVEIDQIAADAYGANHKEVHLWRKDICKISPREVMRVLKIGAGDLDLLACCPPCQGFSAMKRLNGRRVIKDRRNSLIDRVLPFVRKLEPKAIMLENVPHLQKNRRFAEFKKKLRQLGYECNDAILNTADYAVPQRRRRVILLAFRSSTPQFAQKSRNVRTVRDAIGALSHPRKSKDPLHRLGENRTKAIRDRIRAIPKNGGSRTDLGADAQLKCHKECDGFKDVYGRMHWDSVAPTITTGCFNPSKGRFLHPSQNRTISLREAALLQTFPPRYKFPISAGKVKIAEMIGNALPPEFIRRHAAQVARTLSK